MRRMDLEVGSLTGAGYGEESSDQSARGSNALGNREEQRLVEEYVRVRQLKLSTNQSAPAYPAQYSTARRRQRPTVLAPRSKLFRNRPLIEVKLNHAPRPLLLEFAGWQPLTPTDDDDARHQIGPK